MRPTVDYGPRAKMDRFTGKLDQDPESAKQERHNRKIPGKRKGRRHRRSKGRR